jgi:hypothetical protein
VTSMRIHHFRFVCRFFELADCSVSLRVRLSERSAFVPVPLGCVAIITLACATRKGNNTLKSAQKLMVSRTLLRAFSCVS